MDAKAAGRLGVASVGPVPPAAAEDGGDCISPERLFVLDGKAVQDRLSRVDAHVAVSHHGDLSESPGLVNLQG
jgi:hypothetical protein